MRYPTASRKGRISGILRTLVAPLLAAAFLLSTPVAGLEAAVQRAPACRMSCAGTPWCCCKPVAAKRPAARSADPVLKSAASARRCPAGCAAVSSGTATPLAPPAAESIRVALAPDTTLGRPSDPPRRGLPAPARRIQPRAPPALPASL